MENRRAKFYAHLALIAMTVIYAYNYHVSSYILEEIEGHELTLLRIVFAAIAFSFIDYIRIIRLKILDKNYKNKDIPINKKNIKTLGLILLAAILMPIVSQVFFFEGLKLTTPVNASIMRLSTPIAVVFISSILFFKRTINTEKINITKTIGVIIAIIGGFYTILISAGNTSLTSLFQSSGDFLVFISAAAFGAYTIIIDYLMKQGHHFITLLRWSFTIGALNILILGFIGIYDYSHITFYGFLDINELWTEIYYLLFCATLLTFIFNISALKVLSPTLVGTYTCFQPLGTAVIGLMLGNQIDSYIVWTGSLIFIGVIMVSQSELIETSFVRIFNFFKTIRNRLSSPTSTQIINKE